MRLRVYPALRFLCLISLVLGSNVGAVNSAERPKVYLPGDEFLLPPLLNQVVNSGGSPDDGFNVTAIDKKKRHVIKGEWLRYGDRLDLNGRLAIEVIQKEKFKWIGGGVFQARIGNALSVKDDLSYDVELERGWMRVWITPEKVGNLKLRIHTEQGIFEAKDAEFWISSRPAQTEFYLIRGEVRRMDAAVDQGYAVFESKAGPARYLAKLWDLKAMEVKIAAAFPALGKVMDQAKDEWDSGKSSSTYETYRQKGWRKADPLETTHP